MGAGFPAPLAGQPCGQPAICPARLRSGYNRESGRHAPVPETHGSPLGTGVSEARCAGSGRSAVTTLAERIRSGDRRALARGLSVVENRLPGAGALLRELHSARPGALRIGITGAPGVGKSTVAASLASLLRGEGLTVAVLAVDPSSPFSGGAVLGDRVRMHRHHGDPGVFIRSMATRGALGGLAPAVGDALTLVEATGCDAVLIETAGVGQSEVDVVQLAGVVAVVVTPGLGDGVQVAKAGLMEIADVFVVNKADLPGAADVERELLAMVSLIPQGLPRPPVVRTVASRAEGLEELAAALRRRVGHEEGSRYWRRRILERVCRETRAMLVSDPELAGVLDRAAEAVAAGTLNPFEFVSRFTRRLRREWRP